MNIFVKTIVLNSRSIEEIFNDLPEREYFTADELFQIYKIYEPNLNYNTFKSRLRELKRRNLVRDVKRGIYTVSDKPYFKPEISKYLKKISKLFRLQYPDILYCTWSTSWINNFTIHQIISSFNILEVENDVADSIFYNLQDKGYSVFLQPDKDSIDRYVLTKEESLVIIPLISRAPTLTFEGIAVPSLEKILVDIFCDRELFFFISGNELSNVYRYAYKKYTLNFSRMLTYAERRKKMNEIRKILINKVDNSLESLLK